MPVKQIFYLLNIELNRIVHQFHKNENYRSRLTLDLPGPITNEGLLVPIKYFTECFHESPLDGSGCGLGADQLIQRK